MLLSFLKCMIFTVQVSSMLFITYWGDTMLIRAALAGISAILVTYLYRWIAFVSVQASAGAYWRACRSEKWRRHSVPPRDLQGRR